MTSPVLFLDVDGVLNCADFFRLHRPPHPRALCAKRMALLNRVIAETDCRVTVSSTWRMDSDCRAVLRRRGFRGAFSRDWRTPWLRSDNPDLVRGDEIADWLSRNPCSRYAIVDDDSDMLEGQMERFVQTSYEHGLTAEHADRLVELLRAA